MPGAGPASGPRPDGDRGGRASAADPRDWRADDADLRRRFAGTALAPAVPALLDAVAARGASLRHGDLPRWREAIDALPVGPAPSMHLDGPVVVADGRDAGGPGPRGEHEGKHEGKRERSTLLQALHPWRKGPLRLDGVDIDTEWRSDRKWDRLVPHIASLAGRCVLDVGCGSGYHLWRMHAAGCAVALGIEPTLLYACQFEAFARRAPDAPVACLPLTLEALAASAVALGFDTVFSMGVLYHREHPHAHLAELHSLVRPGGELVLETIVADRALDAPWHAATLDPGHGGRYARMGNVHPLPSIALLTRQVIAAGFEHVRTVSLDLTSVTEQRRTDWMRFDSLEEALEPPSAAVKGDDPRRRTVEGLPRPARAILIARVPGPVQVTVPVR